MFAVSVPPIQLIMPIGICDAVHNLWQQDTESSALTSDGWSPRCRGPRNAHGSSSRSPPNFYHRVIATEIGRRQLEEIRITSQLTNPHQRQAVATTHLHHVKQCNVRVVMRLSQHVAFDRNKKRWATDDSSKHKFNIRPVQFRPHWTNPKLGGKQIWIPHAHKSERWLGRYVVSWKMCGVVLVLVGRSLVRALSQASMPWTGKVWKMMICQKISSASRAAGHMFASSQQPHHNHFSDQISLWNTFVRYLSINTKAKKRYLRICRLGRIHPQDWTTIQEKTKIWYAQSRFWFVCTSHQIIAANNPPTANRNIWTSSLLLWLKIIHATSIPRTERLYKAATTGMQSAVVGVWTGEWSTTLCYSLLLSNFIHIQLIVRHIHVHNCALLFVCLDTNTFVTILHNIYAIELCACFCTNMVIWQSRAVGRIACDDRWAAILLVPPQVKYLPSWPVPAAVRTKC